MPIVASLFWPCKVFARWDSAFPRASLNSRSISPIRLSSSRNSAFCSAVSSKFWWFSTRFTAFTMSASTSRTFSARLHQPLNGLPVVQHLAKGVRHHLLCRGVHVVVLTQMFPISIHVPLAGRDADICENGPKEVISIHAPLAGRDALRAKQAQFFGEFQSTRPSRGATDSGGEVPLYYWVFQSTRPSRGATYPC